MRPERLEQNRLIAVERHRQTLKLRRAVAELLPQQHRPAFHLGSREHVVRFVAVAVAAYVLRQPGGPCDSHEPVLLSAQVCCISFDVVPLLATSRRSASVAPLIASWIIALRLEERRVGKGGGSTC